METRASYVLIGFVTLMAILAGLGFFLWLAKVQLDRNFDRYQILFSSVEGLGPASPVRFNGVDVGQVLAITLNSADPSQVRVTIEVSATTPVRQGTIATLQSQGVTGVAIVGLSGGRADAPPLMEDPLTGFPVIPSEVTGLQGLIEDAPDLLEEAIALLKDLRAFASDDNRQSIANILKNVDEATARLDTALDDFTVITENVSKGVENIAAFTGRLDDVADNADAALSTANRALAGVELFTTSGLPRFSGVATDAGRLIDALSRLVSRIERDPARFFLGNRPPEYN